VSDVGIGSWVERRARFAPDDQALRHGSTTRTYAELAERIRRLANGFRARGVSRGDRVAWLGPNHPAFLETLFAAASLGAVTTPLNHRLDAREVEAILLDASPSLAVVDPSLGGLPTGRIRTTLTGSYARQSDYAGNPNRYTADYWLLEGAATLGGLTATAGFEDLGASGGRALTSFQTPLATLHRFNGWADKFLTTPPDGLRDYYLSLGRTFTPSHALPALQASLAWHAFTSDRLVRAYGQEWDAQLGFRVHRTRFLVKYASYDADRFGADTDKFWFQIEWSL